MAKYFYQFARKKLYLEQGVYKQITDLKINWEEIEKEAERLQRIGYPVKNHGGKLYSAAAMFVIDKRCQEAMQRGFDVLKK